MKKKGMISVSINRLKANTFQPRKEFEEKDLAEMVESIKEHGVIQPIIARRVNDDYEIIAGERRLRAAKMAGLKEVPVVEVEAEGIEIAELSLVENIQRKDLNPVEEYEAFKILVEKFRLTQEELSARLGKSRSYIANILRIENLTDDVKTALINGDISFGHAKIIMGLKDEHKMDEVCRTIQSKGLTVRQTEKLINTQTENGKKKGAIVKGVFKDARIFFNEIKKVVSDVRKAGGKAEVMDKETEDYFEIVVRIPKG